MQKEGRAERAGESERKEEGRAERDGQSKKSRRKREVDKEIKRQTKRF